MGGTLTGNLERIKTWESKPGGPKPYTKKVGKKAGHVIKNTGASKTGYLKT